MRNLDLNEMVQVEMPVHMWVNFMASYVDADWQCGAANTLVQIVQDKLLDPIYLNEKLAAMQQAHDEHFGLVQGLAGFMQEPPEQEGP